MGENYDIAFLGGGPAGYQGAIRAAQLGARVAVIEERFVGGVCLNWGCIPTKTVRASAEFGRTLRRAAHYGYKPVDAQPDLAAIIARKRHVVAGLRRSIEKLFQTQWVDLVVGRGRLVGARAIEVDGEAGRALVHASKVVLATGSRPAGLAVFPKSPRILLADEMLDLTTLPDHLLVVGGGAVGVEMAAIFRELGSRVTLVEALDHILPHDDREMASYLLSVLRQRGVKVQCGVQVEFAAKVEHGFNVRFSDGTAVTVDTILVAVGRRFNTDQIGLEDLKVPLDHGRVVVDEHLQTNVPGVYAAGDVICGGNLCC